MLATVEDQRKRTRPTIRGSVCMNSTRFAVGLAIGLWSNAGWAFRVQAQQKADEECDFDLDLGQCSSGVENTIGDQFRKRRFLERRRAQGNRLWLFRHLRRASAPPAATSATWRRSGRARYGGSCRRERRRGSRYGKRRSWKFSGPFYAAWQLGN